MLPLEIFERYFSNYSAHMIDVDGVLYPTLEHAYHAARYTDPKIKEEIRTARSPFLAWKLSQHYKAMQDPSFPERKVDAMESLIRRKCEQHDDVRTALIDSGEQEIRKHITTGPPADGFWDDGDDGTGKNIIGMLWMRVRSERMTTHENV
jgi:ribA/ribD-fused uncharacterized protein